MNYELLTTENAPVKMWTKGVPVEADARQQLINTAKMPFCRDFCLEGNVFHGRGSFLLLRFHTHSSPGTSGVLHPCLLHIGNIFSR